MDRRRPTDPIPGTKAPPRVGTGGGGLSEIPPEAFIKRPVPQSGQEAYNANRRRMDTRRNVDAQAALGLKCGGPVKAGKGYKAGGLVGMTKTKPPAVDKTTKTVKTPPPKRASRAAPVEQRSFKPVRKKYI